MRFLVFSFLALKVCHFPLQHICCTCFQIPPIWFRALLAAHAHKRPTQNRHTKNRISIEITLFWRNVLLNIDIFCIYITKEHGAFAMQTKSVCLNWYSLRNGNISSIDDMSTVCVALCPCFYPRPLLLNINSRLNIQNLNFNI